MHTRYYSNLCLLKFLSVQSHSASDYKEAYDTLVKLFGTRGNPSAIFKHMNLDGQEASGTGSAKKGLFSQQTPSSGVYSWNNLTCIGAKEPSQDSIQYYVTKYVSQIIFNTLADEHFFELITSLITSEEIDFSELLTQLGPDLQEDASLDDITDAVACNNRPFIRQLVVKILAKEDIALEFLKTHPLPMHAEHQYNTALMVTAYIATTDPAQINSNLPLVESTNFQSIGLKRLLIDGIQMTDECSSEIHGYADSCINTLEHIKFLLTNHCNRDITHVPDLQKRIDHIEIIDKAIEKFQAIPSASSPCVVM